MWVVPDPARDLRAGGEGQLAQNAFDVRLRGALRDHQPSGDLAVAQPVAEQDGDLVLTLGQPAGQSGARRRCLRRLPAEREGDRLIEGVPRSELEGPVERGIADRGPDPASA